MHSLSIRFLAATLLTAALVSAILPDGAYSSTRSSKRYLYSPALFFECRASAPDSALSVRGSITFYRRRNRYTRSAVPPETVWDFSTLSGQMAKSRFIIGDRQVANANSTWKLSPERVEALVFQEQQGSSVIRFIAELSDNRRLERSPALLEYSGTNGAHTEELHCLVARQVDQFERTASGLIWRRQLRLRL